MADRCVVDTDVVSFFFKRDTRATIYRPYLAGSLPMISFMTVAELERWALERSWGAARRRRLETFLGRYVIQPWNLALCRAWAEATHEARRRGRPIQTADAWIAASAILHGIPLVTHNRGDYAGVTRLTIVSETDLRQGGGSAS
jgi:predicted nucleic acid-binding protein